MVIELLTLMINNYILEVDSSKVIMTAAHYSHTIYDSSTLQPYNIQYTSDIIAQPRIFCYQKVHIIKDIRNIELRLRL